MITDFGFVLLGTQLAVVQADSTTNLGKDVGPSPSAASRVGNLGSGIPALCKGSESMLISGLSNSACHPRRQVAITGIGRQLPSPGHDRDHPMRATSTSKRARFIKGLDGNVPSEEGPPFIPVHCE